MDKFGSLLKILNFFRSYAENFNLFTLIKEPWVQNLDEDGSQMIVKKMFKFLKRKKKNKIRKKIEKVVNEYFNENELVKIEKADEEIADDMLSSKIKNLVENVFEITCENIILF